MEGLPVIQGVGRDGIPTSRDLGTDPAGRVPANQVERTQFQGFARSGELVAAASLAKRQAVAERSPPKQKKSYMGHHADLVAFVAKRPRFSNRLRPAPTPVPDLRPAMGGLQGSA